MSDEKSDPVTPLRLVKKGRPKGRQVGVKIVLPAELLDQIREHARKKDISIAQEIRFRLLMQGVLDPKDMALGKALRIILDYIRDES